MLYSIRQNKALTVFTLIFLPLTLYLGCWQLERAEFKRQRLSQLAATNQLVDLTEASQIKHQENFQLIRLEGRYQAPYVWFLDNQVWQGKAGVDVISLLFIDGHYLLVNRGWQVWRDRSQLPSANLPAQPMSLVGRLVRPSGTPLVLLPDQITDDYPQLLQSVNLEQLQEQLTFPLLPQILYLNDSSEGRYQPHWQATSMGPEKHVGYAVQWFGLALTLTVMYFYRLRKSQNI